MRIAGIKIRRRGDVSITTPFGKGNLTEVGAWLGVHERLVAPLLSRLRVPVDRSSHAAVVDLGSRTIEDLQRTYLSLLPHIPLVERRDFARLRREWTMLGLPTDVAIESAVAAAEQYVAGKSGKARLEPIWWLLPFDREAIGPVLDKLRADRRGVAARLRREELPPDAAARHRRVYERRHSGDDPRLDANVAVTLGCELQHLDAFYALRLIEADASPQPDDRRRVAHSQQLDPSDLRHRLATEPPTVNAENIRHYRVARAGLGLGEGDRHAKSVVADVLATLAHMEAVPSPTAMSQIVGGDPQQFVDDLIAWGIASGKPIRWWREWKAVRWSPNLDDLRGATHPDAPMRLTALDPDPGSAAASPPTEIIRQVLAVREGDDRIRANIVALEGARSGIPTVTLEHTLRGLRHLLPLMDGLDPSVPHHVNAVLGPYALCSDLAGLDERRRLRDVDAYETACALSASWFGRLRPEERPAARRFLLATPNGAATLFPLVEQRLIAHSENAADRRDDRLKPWIKDPDRTIALLLQKANRTFEFLDTVNACIAWADARIEKGEWDGTGPIHWIHEERFADIARDGIRIQQRIPFSIETWWSKCDRIRAVDRSAGDLHARLTKWLAGPMHRVGEDEDAVPRDPDLAENRYAIAIHGVFASRPGDPTASPHWYEIFKGEVFNTAIQVPPERAAARLEAIRATGVGNPNQYVSSPLSNYPGRCKRVIAHHARTLLGEVCYPVHEFSHGTALAAFSASARYDLPERSGELEQTDLEEDKWEEWTDPQTGEVYSIFKIVRKKQKAETDFVFSPTTMAIMRRLAAMASERLFGGGEWSVILPTTEMKMRGFAASSYLVTDGRKVLHQRTMAALFGILVGSPDLHPGDIKHLLNAMARREGVPIEVRRRWNFHKSASTSEGYGRTSEEERQSELLLFLRMMHARRIAVGAAGGPAAGATAPAAYETRRERLAADRELAAALGDVYRRFGRAEEARARDEEARRLDVELARVIEARP